MYIIIVQCFFTYAHERNCPLTFLSQMRGYQYVFGLLQSPHSQHDLPSTQCKTSVQYFIITEMASTCMRS